ncbi:hypothetical protein [Pseudomonas sp. HS6]|uniref:hypothetical protein n=1 Tax=Pseudomonas sp. HS6 TaxID=2850559 RepID=UPI0020189902|nr:hypothetical protein [Pseudomonas sp. HS6]UQS16424.1 hypothetical protein JJN09_06055 [Pseudomonas sp. HS6]
MQLSQNGGLLDIDNAALDQRFIADYPKLDQKEKTSIVSALTQLTGKHKDGESVDLELATVPRVVNSTFDNAQAFARIALLKMLDTEDFIFLAEKHSLPTNSIVCVDEQARLTALVNGTWIELTGDAVITSNLQDELSMLGECAGKTGGCIFSSTVIGIRQWLSFHQYTVPTTVTQTRNLIASLEFQLPDSPVMGDYLELLMAPPESAFHLSVTNRQTIKQIARDTTQGKRSLLQHLATPGFSTVPIDQKREKAGIHLDNFLQTPDAFALGLYLHDRLGWHLDSDHAEVAARQIRCLVVTALILDLGFDVQRHAKVVAGYHLYHPGNASKTPQQIVEEFEWQLTREAQLPHHFAPLAAHLLLAGAAPQLLVQHTPAELTIGKPGWVVVSQAVGLIELTAPGASRLMPYTRIKAFADLAPTSAAQHTLQGLAAITPIIDWAVLNGVLPDAANDYDANAFSIAASRFDQYVEALNEVESGISITPPDRRKLALHALEHVLPSGSYLEKRIYKYNYVDSLNDQNWLEILATPSLPSLIDIALNESGAYQVVRSRTLKLRVSILDLYLSGDLVINGKFTDKFKATEKLEAPKDALTNLSRLEPADNLFDKAFDTYYQTLQKNQATLLKMAVSSLPLPDIKRLANGLITLYTVRETVNPLNPSEETQRQRNEAKGRYGIILGCQNDREFRCYELFYLRGVCRERPELAEMLRTSGVAFSEPSLSSEFAESDFQPKNQAMVWPLDLSAYKEGSEPRNQVKSTVVVEKLWNFFLQSNESWPVSLFFSRSLDALAEGVLGNHPVATRQELYTAFYGPTELQKIRAFNDVVDTTIINMIVPFKKCIEDVRSGETDRVSEGIGACILDGLAILGLLVGFASTVAGILGKTASSTAKVLSVAKAGAHLAVSIVNPFDGLPALAVQSGRLAKKGVLLLSKHGFNVVETATGQLRKLTGSAQSYDLIKAAQKTDLFQGRWKAAGDLGDPVNLLALQRNNDWYALNLRVGGAWGPKLKNLKVSPLAPLRRLFGRAKPFSYTQAYVKKALPVAKSKLDNATLMLLETDSADVRAVLKHVFGNDSDEVLKHVKDNLHKMRNDLDFVTLANMSFRKGSEANAALRPAAYRRWKSSVLDGSYLKNPPEHFLVIYPEGLDDYYRMAKYDDGRIGDVLIHEMAHGAPDTLDLYYGQLKHADSGPADMDVAGLLDFAKDAHKAHPKNLSNPHYKATYDEGFKLLGLMQNTLPELVKKHPALLNADSYAVAVSMLDQARTHREAFMLNLALIQNGVKKTTKLGFIDGSVRLKLARASI